MRESVREVKSLKTAITNSLKFQKEYNEKYKNRFIDDS